MRALTSFRSSSIYVDARKRSQNEIIEYNFRGQRQRENRECECGNKCAPFPTESNALYTSCTHIVLSKNVEILEKRARPQFSDMMLERFWKLRF